MVKALELESALISVVDLPVGTSIVALARRP
jgi:hypothetical protein